MSRLEQGRQNDCYEVYFTGEEQNPTSRGLMIHRGGRSFIIHVTTPQFVKGLEVYNRDRNLDPSVQIGENFFVKDHLPSVDELCQELSQIPTEVLRPYLIEQIG